MVLHSTQPLASPPKLANKYIYVHIRVKGVGSLGRRFYLMAYLKVQRDWSLYSTARAGARNSALEAPVP